MPKAKVSPSLLAANLLELGKEVKAIEDAGADFHHIDVMDGHFVNNLSFGLPLIRALKKVVKIPLDVHIMISNPDQAAREYAVAGADMVTFHVEAANQPHTVIKSLRAENVKVGIALSPDSLIDTLFPFLADIDLILVMSVNPGFGGQGFIASSLQKINSLSTYIKQKKYRCEISVDGGINSSNARAVVDAGATMLVAGTYVYGAKDRKLAVQSLKDL